jgi:cysteine desulfurase
MREGAGVLPVGSEGLIDLDALDKALHHGPALVAVQQVNNETGVIQPLDAVLERVGVAGGLLLADCAQGAGKIPLPEADFIAISAHKFGGPPGIGALLVRDLATLKPSGGQEKGYRRGTQNLPAIAGMAAALVSGAHRDALPSLSDLRDRLEQGVRAAGGTVIAATSERIPTISAIALPGASKDALLVQLDLAGFAVSAGSACSSGKMKSSHVLEAMGISPEIAAAALRVSFGPQTTAQEVDTFVAAFTLIATRARAG